MNIHFDILSIITTIGTVKGVFLSIIIFYMKIGNRLANKLLSLLVLSFSYSIVQGVIIPINIISYIPHLYMTGMPFQFLFAPLLLVYVKVLSNTEFNFTKKDSLHPLPFFLTVILLLPVFLKTGDEKIRLTELFIQGKQASDSPAYVIQIAFQIQMWTFLVIIWRIINKHKNDIKNIFSSVERISLSWIKFIFIIFFALRISA